MNVEIKKVKLSEIKLNKDNPRRISDADMERLIKSLTDFPDMLNIREIVVDETMTVLGGNMRTLALRKTGAKECTAKIVKGLTEAQKREFVIKDNGSMGEWDFDLLANGWSDLPLDDWGVDLPEDWLNAGGGAEVTEGDAEPQIDRAEELNKIWQVKRGDLFSIGEHRLLCGDSTKAEDVARLMGGEKAGLCLTDPPYEIETKGGGILKTSSAMKGIRDLGIDSFSPESLSQLAPTSVFCCNKPLIKNYIALAEAWGVSWDLCVYHKQNVTPNYGGHLMTDLEYVFVVGDQAPETGRGYEKELYSKLYSGGKDADNETAWSKPVELFSKFVRLYAKHGLVIDPFLGSGTTMVACENLNHKCRAIEISENYCAVILQRMTDAFPGIEIKKISK